MSLYKEILLCYYSGISNTNIHCFKQLLTDYRPAKDSLSLRRVGFKEFSPLKKKQRKIPLCNQSSE